MRNPLPVSRFVLSYPEQLGEGEIGERRIAGELDQTIDAEQIGKLLNLRLGALVAPDERGPHDFVLGIKQNRAMHLPGESDAGDFISTGSRGVERSLNGHLAGAPPIARIDRKSVV